jgi:hypothetical protein
MKNFNITIQQWLVNTRYINYHNPHNISELGSYLSYLDAWVNLYLGFEELTPSNLADRYK